MKLINGLLALLILLTSNLCFGQTSNIYNVKFKIQDSRRIPNNFVSVSFERYGDSIQVFVKSIPSDTISANWKATKREYGFNLKLVEFNKIVTAVQRINCSDISGGLGDDGLDGMTCEIEIGGIESGITYKIWLPDYDTKKRHLESFLEACKLILLTAKLDPEKIL